MFRYNDPLEAADIEEKCLLNWMLLRGSEEKKLELFAPFLQNYSYSTQLNSFWMCTRHHFQPLSSTHSTFEGIHAFWLGFHFFLDILWVITN